MQASRQILGELALLWTCSVGDKMRCYETRVLERGVRDPVPPSCHSLRGNAPVDSPRGARRGHHRALGSDVAWPTYSPEAVTPMV